jgi:hypothetical protein
MPLRQRGGQPISLRHPHLRRLRRRPSGLCQHLHHSSLSPYPPKWIPLPLRQPPRPPMDRSLPSPVVWRLLSMLRILSKGGGGVALARWRGDDDVGVLALARCCRRRGEDTAISIRWEVGGGRVTNGGFKVVAVRGGSHCQTLRLRRPLRSRRWTLSVGGEVEVAGMTATAMLSR